jgi:hypothetical protein
MNAHLESIARHFRFEGSFARAERIPSGHINDSYVVSSDLPDRRHLRYLVQRINHHVFRDPEALMANFQLVTGHLRRRISASGGNPDRQTMTLIPTVDGGSFLKTPAGEYWRAMRFVEGASIGPGAARPDQVYHTARAFGQFLNWLADLSPDLLHETVAGFHHTPRRFADLASAVERDPTNRAALVRPEIAFAEQRVGQASTLTALREAGHLPARVTHNDSKLDNVLLDGQTGRALCVIDLDTVMPGLVHYDFGDMVRSAASASTEDERDLSRVGLDLGVFARLVAGYLSATRDILTPLEVEHLAFSARLLTLECGVRFLTDYLDGDRYFRIHRPDHNLDRCRTQFQLVRDMERQFDQMLQIVDRHRLAEQEPPPGG